MASSIETANLIDGSSVTVTAEGITVVRKMFIKDIPVLRDDDDAVLVRALSTSGVPVVGEQHALLTQCTVREIKATPVSTDQAHVTVTYRSPEQEDGGGGGGGPTNEFTLTYGTSVTQYETQNDVFGAPMFTNFDIEVENGPPNRIKNAVALSVLLPQRTIEARATITGAPHPNFLTYTGYVNEDFWQNGLPRTWLYMGMQATTADGGITYSVVASWLHNQFTWDGFGVHRQPDGSIAPKTAEAGRLLRDLAAEPEVHDGGGVGRYFMYHQVRFDSIFNFA